MMNSDEILEIPPKMIFIIPYRDRREEFVLFIKKMDELLIMINKTEYQYLFVHQCDERDFCRGGLKNIGFLIVKEKYPESYLDITLIFNDIDTYPSESNLITDYCTIRGIIKHFYGYTFALGGIVSITGYDFEQVNGFPNYWGWGFEDNMLNQRIVNANLIIDRNQFYRIDDKRIIQLNTSPLRTVNRIEFDRFLQQQKEGILSIKNLSYTIETKLDIDDVNVNITTNTNTTFFINVWDFKTEYECNQKFNSIYDTRSRTPPFQVGYSAKRRATMNLVHY